MSLCGRLPKALAIVLFIGSSSAFAAGKPKVVEKGEIVVLADGLRARFEQRSNVLPKAAASTQAAATIQYTVGCLMHRAPTCNGDTMATTDEGMGFGIYLDGVKPFIRAEWARSDGSIYKFINFYLGDSRCPPNYYFDYNGPLAGDELCWPLGSFTVWWTYPHVAGTYQFRGYVDSYPAGLESTSLGTVRAGSLEVVAGNSQSTVVNEWLLGPITVMLRNYRGETVSFPIQDSNSTNPFVFTISGPNNSVGATVDPSSAQPGSTGSVNARVHLGDKAGQYTITAASTDAVPMASPGIATALLRKPADDNEDHEEGNGEDCSVADPITIGIGNSFQQETDYARTGLSIIELTRSYNALGSKSKIMGNYWTTTFDIAVLPPSVAGAPVRVRRSDGRIAPFTLQGGQYVSLRPYFNETLRTSGSGWQYVTEDNVIETYDAQGKWTSIADAGGRTLTATYNNKGWLTKVTANTGESLTLAYNTYGQMISATDHTNRVWTYTYNAWANLTQVKESDGLYRTYHYESPHSPYLLTGISISRTAQPQPHERYVRWEFDASGRAISNYYTNGSDVLRRYDISYNDETGERIVTDPRSNQALYQTRNSSGKGFVDAVIGPGYASCGLADSEVERDLDMNVTRKIAFGRVTEFGNYDSKGQAGFMIESAGTASARRIDYTYDPRFIGKVTSVTEPSVVPGSFKVTTRTYDGAGNLTQETVSGFRPDGSPVTRTTTFQYNGPFGQLSLIDGPRTDVQDLTRFDYDATTKRLLRVTDPNGIVIRNNIRYTSAGQIASEDRPNGLHLIYSWYPGTDLLNSVTESATDVSRTTTWTYNDRRLVASLTQSDGMNPDLRTYFTYDVTGDLTRIESGTASIVYTLDAAGNRIREAAVDNGSEKRWLQRTFDAYNRLQDLIRSDNQHHYENHPDGTLTSYTDGTSQSTTFGYDDFKRLTRMLQPGQVETTYGYDVHDRLVRVTAGNQATTQYDYDDVGNLVRLQSPDTSVTTFEHDGAGNVVRAIDGLGQLTTTVYDAGGRVTSVDRIGTEDDETYVYDACVNGVGKRCSVTNGIGDLVKYQYDPFGRVTKQTTNSGAVAWTYDAAGNVVEITYPSQRKVRYFRDAGGNVLSVTAIDGGNPYALVRDVVHLPFGPATSWTYGNGVTETRQFDTQYRPTSIRSGNLSSTTYTNYDGNSNPRLRTVNGDAQTLAFDALSRLDAASGTSWARDYGYDPVGNRSSLVADGQTTTYTYAPQSNRLVSDSQFSYTLDANGNQTQRQRADGSGLNLTYSATNRLLGVTNLQDESLIGAYRYNALGQRTVKSTPYGDTRFVYGLGGELLAEALPEGSITQEYVYLDGIPIALLGPPAAPAAPFVVDQTIDNPANHPSCSVKRESLAVNGSYLLCLQTGPSYSVEWPWVPPYSGDYDLYIRWAWVGNQQCYEFRTGFLFACVGNGATAGTWLYLGRRHLDAYYNDPRLTTYVNDHNFSLAADAIRYVLVHKDLTERDYHYVHTDALGTPLRLSNRSGTVVWGAVYDPFGSATISSDPDGDGANVTLNLRYPGQYYDAETGLQYNYFRDYDNQTGRYLQSDPIGLAGGLNTYAYVGGNPVMWTDPLGLEVLVCRDPAFGGSLGPMKHFWIKTDTQEGGMGTREAGNNAGNEYDPLGARVETVDHSGRSKGEKAECAVAKGADEKKVNELIKPGQGLGIFVPFMNDCQGFVRSVLDKTGGEFPYGPQLPLVPRPGHE